MKEKKTQLHKEASMYICAPERNMSLYVPLGRSSHHM